MTGESWVAEGSVELVAVEKLPAAAVRGNAPGGHPFAEGASWDARIGDGLFHGHPGGGCLGRDLLREVTGDASRYLIDQPVEV
jgi:hypothetical protein